MATQNHELLFFKPGDITKKSFLGSGGFGGVHLATHKNWGDVAVKTFNMLTYVLWQMGQIKHAFKNK